MIEAMDRVRDRHHLALLAYVIMPEHVHLLLFPLDKQYCMARIMRSLKQPVSRSALYWLRQNQPKYLDKLTGEQAGDNRRHHFWQPGGGYDRNVTETATLYRMIDYIHDNPVRRGLANRPTQWPWSSAGWYARAEQALIQMDPLPV